MQYIDIPKDILEYSENEEENAEVIYNRLTNLVTKADKIIKNNNNQKLSPLKN